MKLLPIVLEDELTGETAFDFADGLSRFDYSPYDAVVFQLDDASHIDVNGLAVIVRIYSHLKARDKRLYVVGASDELSRAIGRLGLSRVLNAPERARRQRNSTDPTLSALTGSHAVVRPASPSAG